MSVSGIKQGDYLAQVAFGGFGTFFEVSGYCGEEFSFGIGGSIAFSVMVKLAIWREGF